VRGVVAGLTLKRSRARLVRLAVIVALAAFATTAALRRARPLPGTTTRELVVGGVRRTYLLHAGGDAKPGRPLVLVLHGWHGDAAGLERRTRGTFDKLADRDGAVIAYPQALGDPRWNDGWPVAAGATGPPDDVAFVAALIDALVAELGVDRKRVFAAGLSNGAGMVYRLACERPELVAAVAPVSGTMSAPVAGACQRGAPVAVIAMQGTEDSIVPFDDRQQHDIATWVRRDGCPARPASSRLPDSDPRDGTQTRVDLYAPCAAGTAVAFYIIEGGGHAWPGGDTPWGFFRRGHTARDFDAAVAIWDFFQQHARR
jgi:polyhydroxybutyrate depolymerase